MTATYEENSENTGRTVLLKIDFADNEEYKKFVSDLAESVAGEMRFNDELERNVAYELTHTYMDELAEAVLGKLVEGAIAQKGRSNGKLQALAQDERFAAIKDMENTLYQKLLEKAGN